MGDGIMVIIFCQESLIVMGFEMVSYFIQKNVKNSKKIVWF